MPPDPDWCFAITTDSLGQTWASWYGPDCSAQTPYPGGAIFGFDNPNPAMWSDWTTTLGGYPDPYATLLDRSENHSDEPNGYGYLVHAPYPASATKKSTWGDVKSMFR